MREIRDQIKGPLHVDEHTMLFGQVVGDVSVHRRCRLVLHGQVTGTIQVADTGVLELFGQVGGDVVNAGRIEDRGGQVIGTIRDAT